MDVLNWFAASDDHFFGLLLVIWVVACSARHMCKPYSDD